MRPVKKLTFHEDPRPQPNFGGKYFDVAAGREINKRFALGYEKVGAAGAVVIWAGAMIYPRPCARPIFAASSSEFNKRGQSGVPHQRLVVNSTCRRQTHAFIMANRKDIHKTSHFLDPDQAFWSIKDITLCAYWRTYIYIYSMYILFSKFYEYKNLNVSLQTLQR